MASEVGICNEALSEIGAASILALDQDDKNARECNKRYASLRDKLLRAHPWNFAVARAKLGQLSAAPTYEFDFAYQLPSDWLRILSVHDNDAGVGSVEYRIEGRKVLSGASELWLRYVRRVTDPNTFDELFTEALIFRLAWALARPLIQSGTLEELKRKAFEAVMRKARGVDAQEDFAEALPEGSWVTDRS